MSRLRSATAMMGAALLALLTLNGCDGQRPEASAPPPIASTPPPAAAPELMGAPPESAASPAVSEPPDEGRTFTAMAPVANPEDMSPEERAQVYGHRYDQPDRATEPRHARRHHRVHHFLGDGRRAGAGRAEHHHLTRHGHWPAYFAHGRHHHHAHGSPTARANRVAHEPAQHPAVDASRAAAPATASSETTPSAAAGAAPSPSAALGSSNQDLLSIPGAPYVDLPGFGRVPSRYITAAVMLLLAIVLLTIAAGRGRAAGRRRRPVRDSVGAGPAFSDERPAPRAPDQRDTDTAPFPHHDAAEHSEATRN